MKAINAKAQTILNTLTCDLGPENTHRKIDNGGTAFMAVSVDFLFECEAGKVFAFAHNFEQNGDLIPDPDVEILVSAVDGRAYPTAIQYATGTYNRVVFLEDGKIDRFAPRGQRDLATFVGTWFENIRRQQGIKGTK